MMQVVRRGTRRKTVNALGFEDIEALYATRAVRKNAPIIRFLVARVLSTNGRLSINGLGDNQSLPEGPYATWQGEELEQIANLVLLVASKRRRCYQWRNVTRTEGT